MSRQEAANFSGKLSQLRVGMTAKELTDSMGYPQSPPSATKEAFLAQSLLDDVVPVRGPDDAAKKQHWVYRTKFGDFETVMQAGRILELPNMQSMLDALLAHAGPPLAPANSPALASESLTAADYLQKAQK